VASELLTQSLSVASDLLRGSGTDVYGLVSLSAEASSNILEAVTSPMTDVRPRRQFVKTLVSSLSSSIDDLLQVIFNVSVTVAACGLRG